MGGCRSLTVLAVPWLLVGFANVSRERSCQGRGLSVTGLFLDLRPLYVNRPYADGRTACFIPISLHGP